MIDQVTSVLTHALHLTASQLFLLNYLTLYNLVHEPVVLLASYDAHRQQCCIQLLDVIGWGYHAHGWTGSKERHVGLLGNSILESRVIVPCMYQR